MSTGAGEQLISEKPVPEAAVPHDRLTRGTVHPEAARTGKTVNEIADELLSATRPQHPQTRLMQKNEFPDQCRLVRYAADIALIE